MSWFPQKRQRTWVHKACEAILRAGPVPKHIAIIMDGNRRFAVKNCLERCEGHMKGFDKLAETLEWCLDLGIEEVTVYAFSIENFKRSPDEVKYLMELSRQKFQRLLQEKDLISQHGVCVRIIGDISLLPRDLQELLAEAVSISASNTRATLNVCFAYTARDDMCNAMRHIAQGVKDGLIRNSDISEDLLEKCLYTSNCRDVDLLIRTSGEVRLSDFLLWESSFSCLAFVKVLWPEFSIWHLYASVLHYQRNHANIQTARQNNISKRELEQRQSDFNCVVNDERESSNEESIRRLQQIPSEQPQFQKPETVQGRVQSYANERKLRTKKFLDSVENSRTKYIAELLPAKSNLVLNSKIEASTLRV